MSKTISTCICETNLIPNEPQENVFFYTLYRHKEEFVSEFIRTATSTSPIQICALFSTQGPDNLAAFLNIELNKELEKIVAEVSQNSVLDFDSFANQVINTLNVKVCNFVVTKGGTPLKTSMTLVVIEGDILRVIQVGNTRAVLIRDGKIFSLTEEQTMAHRYVQMGVISAEQEKNHPENMTLTQYLGKMPQDGQVQADTKVHLKLKDDDEICMLGIGFSKKLSAQLRNQILVKPSTTEIKCKELVSAAFNQEVKSGMTAIVMKIESVFLLPGDAVISGDPGHTVMPKDEPKKTEDSGYTDFAAEREAAAKKEKAKAASKASAFEEEDGTKKFTPDAFDADDVDSKETTMFNAGSIKADKVKNKSKKEKKEVKRKASNIIVPILILILFAGIGYGAMYCIFNAAHLIEGFGKSSQTENTAEESTVLYSVNDNVAVYAEESADSAIVATLQKGDPVTCKSQGDKFSAVVTAEGTEGFVLNDLLTTEIPVEPEDTLPEETMEETEAVEETEATTTEAIIDEDIDVEEETTTTAATTAATEATTAATTAATEATTAATEATTEATTAAPAEAMDDPAPATPDETENTAPVIETIPGESGVAEWQADGAA